MIATSLPLFAVAFLTPGISRVAPGFFAAGWILCVGHRLQRMPAGFLEDTRFLFIGVRWWFAKMRGRV